MRRITLVHGDVAWHGQERRHVRLVRLKVVPTTCNIVYKQCNTLNCNNSLRCTTQYCIITFVSRNCNNFGNGTIVHKTTALHSDNTYNTWVTTVKYRI